MQNVLGIDKWRRRWVSVILFPVKQCVRLSGEDEYREFLWGGVIRKLESGLCGPVCLLNKISRLCECVCCAAVEVGQKVIVMNCVTQDDRGDCSWMPLLRTTRQWHSLKKIWHCGLHPLTGVPLNPILSWRHIRVVQVSVSQPYYHLQSPKSLFWRKTNLAKYRSLPLEN